MARFVVVVRGAVSLLFTLSFTLGPCRSFVLFSRGEKLGEEGGIEVKESSMERAGLRRLQKTERGVASEKCPFWEESGEKGRTD